MPAHFVLLKMLAVLRYFSRQPVKGKLTECFSPAGGDRRGKLLVTGAVRLLRFLTRVLEERKYVHIKPPIRP